MPEAISDSSTLIHLAGGMGMKEIAGEYGTQKEDMLAAIEYMRLETQ